VIWLQPWIALSAAAIAFPIFIHLLGRGRARTERFPTLRFVSNTRLQPTRRTRLHDLFLLLLRVAIVLAAVVAMAQPRWIGGAQRQRYAESLARVIVLDTSASMRAPLRSGGRTIDSARAIAQTLANASTVSVLWPTANAAEEIESAVAWLAQQPLRAEVVLVSDFQANGAFSEGLAKIPVPIGIRLVRVTSNALAPTGTTIETRATMGGVALANSAAVNTLRDGAVRDDAGTGSELIARTDARGTPGPMPPRTPTGDSLRVFTDVEWSRRAAAVSGDEALGDAAITVVVADAERARASSAIAAATALSPVVRTPTVGRAEIATAGDREQHGVTIVTHAAAGRGQLIAGSVAIRAPWMVDAVAALRASEVLRAAAFAAPAANDARRTGGSTLFVAHNADGRAVITAQQSSASDAPRMLLTIDVDASSDAGAATLAALVLATRRAVSSDQRQNEREPSFLREDELRPWQRAPSTTPAASNRSHARDPLSDPSDGRWIWVLVLVLLGAETALRRRVSAMQPHASTTAKTVE